MPKYNRAAAFVEYARGTTLEEIAHALAIPYEIIKRWEHEEKWALIAPRFDKPTLANQDEAERAQKKINENRERNLAIAVKLQEDLLDMATKLRDGTLKSVRVFANGLRVEVEPTLRDRCDLALYARNVAELSYRALGDVESTKNAPAETGLPSAGQITIVLPPPVAAPRAIRALDVESEVVEIGPPPRLTDGDGSPNRSNDGAKMLDAEEIVRDPTPQAPAPGHPAGNQE
jgi:hypothetical protein